LNFSFSDASIKLFSIVYVFKTRFFKFIHILGVVELVWTWVCQHWWELYVVRPANVGFLTPLSRGGGNNWNESLTFTRFCPPPRNLPNCHPARDTSTDALVPGEEDRQCPRGHSGGPVVTPSPTHTRNNRVRTHASTCL
jgi:hypothetical protein